MKIDLRQFDDFPAHAVIEASDGEIQPFDELVSHLGKTTLNLSLQKSESEYFCQGIVRSSVTMQCSRCARDFECELEGATDFIVRTQSHVETPDSDATDDEEYVYAQGNSDTIDVTALVLQGLTLAMPMKPLCREECKGLCPECGVNFNERACSCAKVQTDPRWDGLRDFLSN